MARHRQADRDYAVGHGRPPKAGQFKPGTSGNPRGRPKQAKTLDEVVYKRFFAKVTVRENGQSRKITVLEVVIGRLAKAAAEGDLKSIGVALKLIGRLQSSDGSPGPVASPQEDRLVLEELARIIGGSFHGLVGLREGA